MANKKSYVYKIESLNWANGEIKDEREYESSVRLKEGNIYFRLPGLEVGSYRVIEEVSERGAEDERE